MEEIEIKKNSQLCLKQLQYLSSINFDIDYAGIPEKYLDYPLDLALSSKNETMVKYIDNQYIIYNNRPMFAFTDSALANFVGYVQFDGEKVFLTVRMKTGAKIITFIILAFGIALALFRFIDSDPFGILFLLFVGLGAFQVFKGKTKFKLFIVNFLNQI